MSSENTVSGFNIKGFSPLTTPDITKRKKKKYADRKTKLQILKHENVHLDSDTESCVDRDIAKFASSITEKLSRQSDVDSDLSEFSPKKKSSVDVKSEFQHQVFADVYSKKDAKALKEKTKSKFKDISNIDMAKKVEKLKPKLTKAHQMSESDSESNIDKRGVTPSPRKSPRKSMVAKNKSPDSQSNNDKREVAPSPRKSPRKSMETKHAKNKKSPDKVKKDLMSTRNIKVERFSGSNDGNDSDDEDQADRNMDVGDDDNSSNSAGKQTVELKYYKPEDGFEMRTDIGTSQTDVCVEDLKGKDLWLIKTPIDFDIHSLNEKVIDLNGLQAIDTESEKKYEVHAFEDPSLITSGLHPMIPSRRKKTYTAGPKFKGQIHIIETIEVPPVPEIVVPEPVCHKVPPDLQPKYKPFGSRSPPRPPISETVTKRKHTENDIDSFGSRKKKKKKHKHHKDKT